MALHSNVDHTGLPGVSTVSYASNANQVGSANAGGAATTQSRGDHVHLGVSSIAHSSNTFTGPVTLVAEGTIGITKSATGTLNINSVAGGGAAAGGGITFSTAGTTSAGASFATTRGAYAKSITLGSAGMIASIAAFVKGDATNHEGLTAILYSDSSGPTNIIAMSGPTITTNGSSDVGLGLINTTVRAITLPIGYYATAGTYWIAVFVQNNDGASLSLAYNSGTGSDQTQAVAGADARDSSITAFSAGSNDYCIFANIIR